MDSLTIIIAFFLGLGALIPIGFILYSSLKARNQGSFVNQDAEAVARARKSKMSESESDKLRKQLAKKNKPKKEVLTDEMKFFRAGLMTVEDRQTFYRLKVIGPIVASIVLGGLLFLLGDATLGILGLILGAGLGLQLPQSYIDRKIQARHEEIMYYLPLVIEQIVIGVSSSLDTGPCMQQVIDMADERGSHNAVTELLKHSQQLAKSGVYLEDAMNDVGSMSGHTELKLAFKSLAQVAKHGGEISKQLQELADTVSSQRETTIEGIIKKLELKATGPVGLVFFGFMVIFLSGLAAQVMKAF